MVVGLDIEAEMLKVAGRTDGISYVLGAGEHLPFDARAFELVTVCSGIHWLHPGALAEVHRVLASGGTFCVYDVWFPAEMVDVPAFSTWMHEGWMDDGSPRYPAVATNEYGSVLGQLVDFLMTHSERISAITLGRETEDEQRDFLSEGMRPYFEDSAERRLLFGIHAEACGTLEG